MNTCEHFAPINQVTESFNSHLLSCMYMNFSWSALYFPGVVVWYWLDGKLEKSNFDFSEFFEFEFF